MPLRFTDTGTGVRAAADRGGAPDAGIPVRRLDAQIWVIAAVLSFVSVALTAGVAAPPFGLGVGRRVLRALAAGARPHDRLKSIPRRDRGRLESGIRWNTGDVQLAPPILAALIVVALVLQRRGVTLLSAMTPRPGAAPRGPARPPRWPPSEVRDLCGAVVLAGGS